MFEIPRATTVRDGYSPVVLVVVERHETVMVSPMPATPSPFWSEEMTTEALEISAQPGEAASSRNMKNTLLMRILLSFLFAFLFAILWFLRVELIVFDYSSKVIGRDNKISDNKNVIIRKIGMLFA